MLRFFQSQRLRNWYMRLRAVTFGLTLGLGIAWFGLALMQLILWPSLQAADAPRELLAAWLQQSMLLAICDLVWRVCAFLFTGMLTARLARDYHWSTITIVGWLSSWGMFAEAVVSPAGASAHWPMLLAWVTLPLHWCGGLLACPFVLPQQTPAEQATR
jgi:multisubunit Na+/H+ antiporter MnhG subunit